VASRTWAVDRMIAKGGRSYFDMPACVAPGDYTLRIELIALHSASSRNGAQFYMSCANIRVTGSGSFVPSQTYSIPGAYRQNDPSILINIWGAIRDVADNKCQNFKYGGKGSTKPLVRLRSFWCSGNLTIRASHTQHPG